MGSVPTALTIESRLHGTDCVHTTAHIGDMSHAIGSFGVCSSVSNPMVAAATSANSGALTPQPCEPVVLGPWVPGSLQASIDGSPALTDTSTCSCAWAGLITITTSGDGPSIADC